MMIVSHKCKHCSRPVKWSTRYKRWVWNRQGKKHDRSWCPDTNTVSYLRRPRQHEV